MSVNENRPPTKLSEDVSKATNFKRNSIIQREHKVQTLLVCHDNVTFTKLPLLKDCKRNLHEQLLIQKLEQCCVVFDFLDQKLNYEARENKTATLIELCEYFVNDKHVLTEELYPEIINMVTVNIFRAIPPSSAFDDFNEPEDSTEEASWIHLKLIYQLFIVFLDLPDFSPSIAGKFIDERFLIQILEIFNSSDTRERACLKTVLHRIYGKLLGLRSFVRNHINNIFLRFIYETETLKGIGELLEVFGSIINGFIVPLKDEHKTFLQKVLIPLHKPSSLCFYHSQLTYCVIQFLEKDEYLTEMVILGLLKYWPVTCSQKQVMFLNEIEKILQITDSYQFEKIQEPLFKKIAQCISSPNFLVSQRALYLWNNDEIANHIENNNNMIMPIVFPSVYRISKTHWNNAIVSLVGEVLKLFHTLNPELYLCLKEQYNKENSVNRIDEE